jgi:hypothetical protein
MSAFFMGLPDRCISVGVELFAKVGDGMKGEAAYRGGSRASTTPARERYAVTDHSVFKLTQPGTFCDPLTEVLRTVARALLAQAVEAEVAAFLESRYRLVRAAPEASRC